MTQVGPAPLLWLQQLSGNEQGWMAWDLRYLGFATWAATREAVVARAAERLQAHRLWLAGHGLSTAPDPAAGGARTSPGGVAAPSGPEAESDGLGIAQTAAQAAAQAIVQTVHGNEVLFDHDRHPATPAEIEHGLRLLGCSRADLLATVGPMTDALLDWDPPYRDFAAWARWRTVRQVLSHIAGTEIGYYLPWVGYEGPDVRDLLELPWQEQLRISRARTVRFLEGLSHDGEDRLRLRETDEGWSLRKVLRRLVWHELLHLKSIRRIARDHAGSGPTGRG